MGCGCLIALATLLSPRLGIVIAQLFTDRLEYAFSSFWIGFIGFLFLPWTTLAWAVAYQPQPTLTSSAGVTGFGYVVVALGVIFDISSYGSGERARRERDARV